jgi:hypothetical protein
MSAPMTTEGSLGAPFMLAMSGGKREQKVDRILALTESVKQSLDKIKCSLDSHEDNCVEIEIKLAIAEHRVLHSAFLRLSRNLATLEEMNDKARTAANSAAAMVAGSPPHSPQHSEASPSHSGGSSAISTSGVGAGAGAGAGAGTGSIAGPSTLASTLASTGTSGEQSQGTEGWILPDC